MNLDFESNYSIHKSYGQIAISNMSDRDGKIWRIRKTKVNKSREHEGLYLITIVNLDENHPNEKWHTLPTTLMLLHHVDESQIVFRSIQFNSEGNKFLGDCFIYFMMLHQRVKSIILKIDGQNLLIEYENSKFK
jgi:hypothetical protein